MMGQIADCLSAMDGALDEALMPTEGRYDLCPACQREYVTRGKELLESLDHDLRIGHFVVCEHLFAEHQAEEEGSSDA